MGRKASQEKPMILSAQLSFGKLTISGIYLVLIFNQVGKKKKCYGPEIKFQCKSQVLVRGNALFRRLMSCSDNIASLKSDVRNQQISLLFSI
jgi:hypothetical protein